MSCPDVKKIELYINGKLSEDEKAQLDAHFAECGDCRSQFEEIRKNEMLLPQIKSLLIEPHGLTIKQAQSFLPKRYHIVMKVSHGGSGQVFKASESSAARWVAIKFLPKEVGLNEDRWREARLMGGLNHPNIATLYLPEEKKGIRFFVMEWIDGRPLIDACAAKPLIKKLELFLKVLDAISIAHEKNIIHRDIKPSNILVDLNLEPKILDFGISVERHRMDAVDSNIFVGSPPYSAPEQIPPVGNITLATDVFSLGILLYQLMTDELPFSQTTIHELFEAIKHATPKPPRSINPQIPEELGKLCLKAMEKDPKRRYIDAKKFAESIRKYLEKDARPVLPGLNDFKNSVVNSFYLSPPDPAVFDLPIKENDLLADRYRILGEIGKSVGTVYRAYDSALQMELAIKVLVLNNENAEDSFEQLRREFLSRSKINDFTHVIKSFDIHPANFEGLKLAILPMEYANGGSFRKWLSEHYDIESRMSEGVDLFIQACLGVQAIHVPLIVHMDVKPENFLLCINEEHVTIKVTDFGISQTPENLLSGNVPGYSVSIGTLPYTSPEQIRNDRPKDIKSTSDIYSLGIILFEILDGSPPFQGTQEQLKEQHLNKMPPRLKKELKPWQPIIDRCLAKEPENRYSKIEYLIKDLDNIRRGWALSVDIACSNCGHINIDPKKIDCKECLQPLSEDFFRPCPRCTRSVRLDQDNCPFCLQHGVAAHYLLKERMEKIEMLKDEDPARAIELLDLVFKDGAGDSAKRAEELIADLNQKQKQIHPLTAKANKFREAGEIEKAIKAWREILNIIPRHRIADEKISNLEILLKNVNKGVENALIQMDEAQFTIAEKSLQRCLELVPNQDNVLNLLKCCHKRVGKYSEAFDKALELHRQRLLRNADANIRIALQYAPKSRNAINLSNEISQTLKKTEELVRQAYRQLSWAEFEDVGKKISEIKKLQADNKEVLKIEDKFAVVKKSYDNLITDTELSIKSCDLTKAAGKVAQALELCPDSPVANSLSNQINANKEKVQKLLKQATSAVRSAEFNRAEFLLRQIEYMWATVSELSDCKNLLECSREQYHQIFKEAETAKKKKDLEHSLKKAKMSQNICPDSKDVSELIAIIISEQKKVRDKIQSAKTFCNKAEFDEATMELNEAENLWANLREIDELRDNIAETSNEYEPLMILAKRLLKKKKFQDAMEVCGKALKLCPQSSETKSIEQQISKGLQNILERKRKRAERFKKAFDNLLLLTPKFVKWIIVPAIILLVIFAIGAGIFYGIKSLVNWVSGKESSLQGLLTGVIFGIFFEIGWIASILPKGMFSHLPSDKKFKIALGFPFVALFMGGMVGGLIMAVLVYLTGMSNYQAGKVICAIFLIPAFLFMLSGIFAREH